MKIASIHLRIAMRSLLDPGLTRIATYVAERFRVWVRFAVAEQPDTGVTWALAPVGQESEITIRVFAADQDGSRLERVASDLELMLQPALDDALTALAQRRRARQLAGQRAARARWSGRE